MTLIATAGNSGPYSEYWEAGKNDKHGPFGPWIVEVDDDACVAYAAAREVVSNFENMVDELVHERLRAQR